MAVIQAALCPTDPRLGSEFTKQKHQSLVNLISNTSKDSEKQLHTGYMKLLNYPSNHRR